MTGRLPLSLHLQMPDSIQLHDRTFTPFISEERIDARVRELATVIEAKHGDQSPLFVAVLNGAFIFAADLMRQLTMNCSITFVKIRSYQGTESSGFVRDLIGLEEPVENRHVIILEDIVDTGRTLGWLIPHVESRKPASLQVVALFSKTEAREIAVKVDYIGFEIPARFIVGYGLDYDGLGRNLSTVYQEVGGQTAR